MEELKIRNMRILFKSGKTIQVSESIAKSIIENMFNKNKLKHIFHWKNPSGMKGKDLVIDIGEIVAIY